MHKSNPFFFWVTKVAFLGCSAERKNTSEMNWKLNNDMYTPKKSSLIDFTNKVDTKGGIKTTFQGKVYNFLERPTGWKCFLYHMTV